MRHIQAGRTGGRRGAAGRRAPMAWLHLPMIGAASAFLTAPAGAQTAAEQANASEDRTALTEIIVTARKRVETAQSIPESIEAFGAQEIADAHITKIDDLANLISTLNITP